jgi:hypothetical protein
MFENKKVAHALVYDKNHLGIDEDVRKSLKVFYKRNLFIDELKANPASAIIEDSPDKCIWSAANLGFNFLALTWEGNIFNIYDFHQCIIKSIIDIENKTAGNWLVSGHIMDQYRNRLLYRPDEAEKYKDSFFLFPITALINLDKWTELGNPIWGASRSDTVVVKAVPSKESVHDGYTPLSLSPSTEFCETSVKDGWNIINESLKNDLTVYNLSNNIRSNQYYLYPENDVDLYNSFWKNLHGLPKLKNSYEKVFELTVSAKLENRIPKNNWAYFLRNTETPWPNLRSEDLSINEDFECFVFPCSGFKDFIVSGCFFKINKTTKIIHYDILQPCIDIKKRIIENWDGTRDHLKILLLEIQDYYKSRGKEHCYHMNHMKDLSEVYDEIIPYFSDEKELEEKWKIFQNHQHFYFNIDLLDCADEVCSISNIVGDRKVYISLSDIGSWRMNLLGYSISYLRNQMEFSVRSIVKNKESAIIDYKDPATDLHHLHNFKDMISTLHSDYEV